jgi:hypothetical protein
VSSYDFAVSLGLMPIGMAVAGPLAEAVGLQQTLAGMSALGMLAALLWLAAPGVRHVRRGEPATARSPDPPTPPAAPVEPAVREGAALAGVDGRRFACDASDVRT